MKEIRDVAGEGLRHDQDFFCARGLFGEIIFKQIAGPFRKGVAQIIEPGRKNIRIDHADFKTGVADVDRRGDGHTQICRSIFKPVGEFGFFLPNFLRRRCDDAGHEPLLIQSNSRSRMESHLTVILAVDRLLAEAGVLLVTSAVLDKLPGQHQK